MKTVTYSPDDGRDTFTAGEIAALLLKHPANSRVYFDIKARWTKTGGPAKTVVVEEVGDATA